MRERRLQHLDAQADDRQRYQDRYGNLKKRQRNALAQQPFCSVSEAQQHQWEQHPIDNLAAKQD